MAEGRPHLVAVETPPPASESAPEASGPNRLPIVLLAAALAVCAIGWLQARREVAQLSDALATTQATLVAAEGRIAAEETRRAAVRGQVQGLRVDASALAGRLAELEVLVAEDLSTAAASADPDHEPAADAQPTGNEATSGN